MPQRTEPEFLFLKKAAAFFAKEIDERFINSLRGIIRNLESGGFFGG